MSSYYQCECVGCGLPCVGFYCYQCTCQQCGVNFINGVCLNCTNGDGKPVTCCVCEGPLNGGFCSFCTSRAGNSFAYDPNPNSFNDSPSVFTHPPQLQFETYLCELCGNNAHYGYDCPPQFPLVYEQEPCHNQNFNDNYFPQSSSQQYICCQNCGGPHATFECQPMSQNLYNSNSSGFDQFQPPQFPVIHQPPQETSAEILQARENLMNSIQTFLKKFNRISFRETPKVLTRAWEKFFEIQHAQPEDIQELLHKLLKDLQIISEEMAEYINLPSWNRPAYYYEDDDEEYTIAITPDLPTEEPDNSLSMGDEHLSTIPETESDEVIKSSVENLVPIPSEPEDFSDIESECDVPVCDDSTTFSNPLFDSDNDSTSSDDESFSNENVPKEIYSNPLFDEEIISDKIDASIISSLKINSLLEQFSGELAHIDPIPPGIEKAEFDLEEEIRLVENLLYDNSSPRRPEELNFIDPLPLPEIESSNLDHFNDPSSPRPPPEPPDVEICFDFEPDTGVVTTKVVKGISEHYVLMPNILPTLPTFDPDLDFTPSHDSLGSGNKIFDPGIFIEVQSERLLSWDEFSISFIHDPLCPVFDLLLPFSSENEDKVFNPGILISPLLSHRGEIISNFSKSPMMISGGDIPHLDVSYKGLETKQKRAYATWHYSGGDTWPSNHLVRGTVHRMQVRGLESEAIIGVRGSAIEGSRRPHGMLLLVDPAVKSWRTRYAV
ncbi:hypothetical protein Tco_0828620 [Tanacetum coccineum]